MIKTYVKTILLPLVLGSIIGLLTNNNIYFNSLIKPALTPKGFIFPIVWTILYIIMGISYGRLSSTNKLDNNTKYIYYLQLIVNLIWPIIFFTLKQRFISLIWIILLAILVLLMIIKFYKKEKWVGLIQIPYLLWVLFATYLNLFFFILNK